MGMCTFHLLLWVGFAMAQYPARERVTEESIKLYRLATSPEKTRSIFSSPSCLCMRHFVLRTWWHVAWHNFFKANSRRLLIVLLVLERVCGCICHPTFHRGCRGFLRSQFDTVKIWGLSEKLYLYCTYTVLILYLYCTYTVLILYLYSLANSCQFIPWETSPWFPLAPQRFASMDLPLGRIERQARFWQEPRQLCTWNCVGGCGLCNGLSKI